MKFNLQVLRKNPDLKVLLLRTGLALGILLASYFVLFLWLRHQTFFSPFRIDENFYLPWLTGLRKTDFLNTASFVLIAFIIWNRELLVKEKIPKRNVLQTIVFGAAAFLSIAAHYALKYWIGGHPDAVAYAGILALIKLLFVGLFILFVVLASYNWDFIRGFLKKYWRSITIFLGIGVVYYFLIQLFQMIWYKLSYFVGKSIYWLLNVTHSTVYFSPGTTTLGPRLGVEGFIVGISKECSGIDSLLLFISLYIILLVLDWNRLDKKRMGLILIPGIIGTVLYNILRIYLLLLVGIYIDPEFAVDIFHTNIGWILFLAFFVFFWHFGSKWVYSKNSNRRHQ